MALTNTIYQSPVFQQACNQFDLAADILGMDAGVRERTKRPRRCVVVRFVGVACSEHGNAREQRDTKSTGGRKEAASLHGLVLRIRCWRIAELLGARKARSAKVT